MHSIIVVESPIEAISSFLLHAPAHAARRAVVLIGAERLAHAIRRHLSIDLQRPDALAGVRFQRPEELAREILVRAGRVRLPGWEAMRRLRILDLFESGAVASQLRYFSGAQLGAGQGYVDAFARTIIDLEASGLTTTLTLRVAEQLARADQMAADRLHDVAITWAAADAACAAHVTAAQMLSEAAALVTTDPSVALAFGQCFAMLTVSPSSTLLRFVRALPECRVVFHAARPLRTGTHRWRALLDLRTAETGEALPEETAARPAVPPPGNVGEPGARRNELQLVQRFLFERPEVLTDPERPRSAGADGTVDLEEYASIDEEIEAAATWVAEQVAANVPLEQIALIVPEVDPYAEPLIDRLRRLTGGDGDATIGAHVAGGLSLGASPAGLRLSAVLTALATSLETDATLRVLPALRRADQAKDDPHARLSPSRTATVVYGAGVVGGSSGDPDAVREWTTRLSKRRDMARAFLAASDAGTTDRRTAGLERQDAQRWLKDIEPILPAIEALQQLAEAVLGGVGLDVFWRQLRSFEERWLRMPPAPPNLLAILEQRLQPILASSIATTVRGAAALRCIRDLLQSERWQTARFGEPCVFIGTPAQAAGLQFAAVRVLGLAEGALPHTPHDDPIIPDALRESIEAAAGALAAREVVVPRLADRVLDDLHDILRVILGTGRRLALSVPRQWVDRSDREVSGILLEAATALGRPAPRPGDEGDVPTAARLRAAYLNPGRAARAAAAETQPLSPRAVLAVIASGADASTATTLETGRVFRVPASWIGGSALAIDRVWTLLNLDDSALVGITDGIVSDAWPAIVPPGLTAQRPISATGLLNLLSCPHRFLLERVLYFRERPTRPANDAIPAILYGALFHAVAERFFAEAGAALCRRDGALDEWLARARVLAEEEFETRRYEYPLRGAAGVEHERARLLRQIEHLVRHEWQTPRREFVASELDFGHTEPIVLEVDGGPLYLRGAIDRVDRIGAGGYSVRDLKTGRVRDLHEEAVNVSRDLQIGLYALALEATLAANGDSQRVMHAAYVHPSATQEPDRAFEGTGLDHLREQTHEWLSVARQLLSTGSFPRTPNPEDCTFCPFVAACGDGAQARSQRKLAALPSGHVLERFAHLKRRSAMEDA